MDRTFGKTNEIRSVEHAGETIRLVARRCEGTYSNPYPYWMVGWQCFRKADGVEFGESTRIKEPCEEKEVLAAADDLEALAKIVIDSWDSSPSG